jgi:hypothetical protein
LCSSTVINGANAFNLEGLDAEIKRGHDWMSPKGKFFFAEGAYDPFARGG